MAQAIMERNKTVDVAVSQDDLVALAPVAPLSCRLSQARAPIAPWPQCRSSPAARRLSVALAHGVHCLLMGHMGLPNSWLSSCLP